MSNTDQIIFWKDLATGTIRKETFKFIGKIQGCSQVWEGESGLRWGFGLIGWVVMPNSYQK